MLIGYARVSTQDQQLHLQLDNLLICELVCKEAYFLLLEECPDHLSVFPQQGDLFKNRFG
jgi:hypothetical protein